MLLQYFKKRSSGNACLHLKSCVVFPVYLGGEEEKVNINSFVRAKLNLPFASIAFQGVKFCSSPY